jgi:hypothetical protein
MQPAQGQLQRANPAVRNGLIFGAILAAVNILSVIIQWVTGSYQSAAQAASSNTAAVSGTSFLGCLTFLIALALAFIAGMNTVRVTGRVGTGAIAGLITGVVGELVGGILGVILVIALVTPQLTLPAGSNLTVGQMHAVIIGTAIAALILGLIIDGGIGAGLGAIGGLLGKSSYRGPEQSYQETYYPGGAGQMGYPPPGGYVPPQAGDYPQPEAYPPPSAGLPPSPGGSYPPLPQPGAYPPPQTPLPSAPQSAPPPTLPESSGPPATPPPPADPPPPPSGNGGNS